MLILVQVWLLRQGTSTVLVVPTQIQQQQYRAEEGVKVEELAYVGSEGVESPQGDKYLTSSREDSNAVACEYW